MPIMPISMPNTSPPAYPATAPDVTSLADVRLLVWLKVRSDICSSLGMRNKLGYRLQHLFDRVGLITLT